MEKNNINKDVVEVVVYKGKILKKEYIDKDKLFFHYVPAKDFSIHELPEPMLTGVGVGVVVSHDL